MVREEPVGGRLGQSSALSRVLSGTYLTSEPECLRVGAESQYPDAGPLASKGPICPSRVVVGDFL